MLGSIFIGFAGMTAYSRGLGVIGNNVANLNTPGFKVGDPLFSNLVYRGGDGAVSGFGGTSQNGAGVAVDTDRRSFRQGDFTDQGNPLDAAIDGNGFFVLEQSGRLVYTRAGQFELDDDGYLVHRGSRDKVMVTGDSLTHSTFNVEQFRVFPPAATTEVSLGGNLARTGSATYLLSDIKIKDTSGGERVLNANFVRDATNPLAWTMEVRNEDNTVLGSLEIELGDNGTPAADYSVTVSIGPKEDEDLPAFDVAVKLGAAGTFSGVTSMPSDPQSLVQVRHADGVALGYLTKVDFTDHGEVQLNYSNGEKKAPATLVLARFMSPTELRDVGGGMFVAEGARSPVLALPLSSGIGRVVGGQVELSNVDLTDQFANLIIVQRGYQASSQLTSIANDLIQQLLQLGDHR
jgi:flagellar hook protein FlgE